MTAVRLEGRTIASLAADLARGAVTSRALTEAALERIAGDPSAFVRVNAEGARAAADAADAQRARGIVPSALAGLPVSVKDLFDVAGEATAAGSRILRNAPPASVDAPVVARLRAAGAVIVGRTHMSEFAFSGLGTNPHVPRLANPRDAIRVPGGSSSGAAVSVARGQAVVALGTDTGGSVRIPAAFCGLTGFKPTQRRVTREGAFPLAESLDSVGPIANSVACCAVVDAIIADTAPQVQEPVSLARLSVGVPSDWVLDDLDDTVAAAFQRALGALIDAGARIERFPFPELLRIPGLNARGPIANAEAYALHARSGVYDRGSEYDPHVLARVQRGAKITSEAYFELLDERARLIRHAHARTEAFAVLAFPTVACVPPAFAAIETADAWSNANAMALRNASVVNLLDRCAVTLPCHAADELPVGLMLVGDTMADARLLAIASAAEAALRGRR